MNITPSQKASLVNNFNTFYSPQNITGYEPHMLNGAIKIFEQLIENNKHTFGGTEADSFDRERLRDIILYHFLGIKDTEYVVDYPFISLSATQAPSKHIAG